ncbi:radical SAM protein [Methanocella sp. CWC-04]|uniref:Radical SAM protein n=2 Tax=Methanooceanicella nereidis TaxID=2052831 RepID=A0AAP2RG80_9EURY|nr:radical SAM protein [Methanocella sp. CWC-04]
MGCEHACIYCYAPYTLHYQGSEPWGTFTAARMNIPVVLEREIRKAPRGVIGISTVVDPYQKLEKKLELTRKCLDVLLPKDFPICIQTKSDLILRDMDIIKEFSEKEVGFTITAADDISSSLIEPGAPPVSRRLKAMRVLADENIDTWAFIGPAVPGIIDRDRLESIILSAKEAGAKRVMFDRLRLRPGMWNALEDHLKDKDIGVLDACRSALFGDSGFFLSIKDDMRLICEKLDMPCEFNY